MGIVNRKYLTGGNDFDYDHLRAGGQDFPNSFFVGVYKVVMLDTVPLNA